jgi:hypothetical protein
MGLRIYHDFATRDEAEAYRQGVEYANDGDLECYEPFASGGKWLVKTIDHTADDEGGELRRDDDPHSEPPTAPEPRP